MMTCSKVSLEMKDCANTHTRYIHVIMSQMCILVVKS